MKAPETVKVFMASLAGPMDLLGALLDKDTSERVRGALMVVLCILGGWFAHDYFGSNITREDLHEIRANQRVNLQLSAENARKLCRDQTDRNASECRLSVEDRMEQLYQRALQDIKSNSDD